MNKIDIIIPAYNAQEWLSNMLDCLVKQTISEKLVITVVDDCSKKDYKDVIEKYRDRIAIQLIRTKKRKGVGKARNIGVSNTNNKYIMFLDADDTLHNTTTLEIMYNEAEKNNYKIVYAKEEENGNIRYYDFHVVAKILRRDVIMNNNLKFIKCCREEDITFMMKYYFFVNIKEIKKINEIFYEYRHVNSNSMIEINKLFVNYDCKPLFKSFDSIYSLSKKFNNYTFLKNNSYRMFINLAMIYYKNKDNASEKVLNRYLKYCKKFYNKYNGFINYYIKDKKTYQDDLNILNKFLILLNV